jgi:hypothetical protein
MSATIDQHMIRELAHRLWEARGRRDGHELDDWLDAERQVKAFEGAAPLPDVTRDRSRQGSKVTPNAKAPTVPIDEVTSNSPELPKVGSRDAPGG